LDEFFLPFNQRLARMLHDERFLWKLWIKCIYI
jgi:hypothetical protein